MKKPKKYTEHLGAKVDPKTAKIIKDSNYNVRQALENFAHKIADPVESLLIRKTVLLDEIEHYQIREINPRKEELGDIDYKLKQFNIDVTVDPNVLSIARRVKNLYKRQNIYNDLLDFIKSDKNIVAEVNRCNMPFDEFINVINQVMKEN